MDKAIAELKPEPNDLVVVPEDFVLHDEPNFLIHKMKFLHKPSIIRSGGGSNMSFFESLTSGHLWTWLTGRNQDPRSQENERKKEETKASAAELPTFFRYSRPFDEKNGFSFGPKGGVTFFIELNAPEKTLAFSYALCHHDDLFNRKTARHIAKQRFDHGDWYEIKNYDSELSVTTNIKNAIEVLLCGKDCSNLELTQFSSLSERLNEYELNLIFERI